MNIIAEKIASFLKHTPPFNHLNSNQLLTIATSIRVLNLEKDKVLFQVNDFLHDYFYIVASGMIHLTVVVDAEEILLNKRVQGGIFGLRPFFAKNNYMMTAKAREESIVYAIPIDVFRPFIANNSAILDFLLHVFAANTNNSSDNENFGENITSENGYYSENQFELQYFQSLAYNQNPIQVKASDTVQEVALLMTNAVTNNAVICKNGHPIGIVSHAEMSTKIATGKFLISTTVDKIMSKNVITVLGNISLAEAQLLLLKYNVTHLCITKDGTENSSLKGIISEHDLIVAQASNPGVLMKEIKRALTPDDLKSIRDQMSSLIQKSFYKNIPISNVNSIVGEINLAIIKRSVELSILDLGSPPVRFAWLSIGSQGRKEQLLNTDQDSILVFEDVPEDKHTATRDYFIKLGKRTTAILEKIGYEICPNGHSVNNSKWCKSLNDWNKEFVTWINYPSNKKNSMTSIFFDFEIAFGDRKIEEAIVNTIFDNVKNNVSFFDFLGNDALRKNTPLTFFKNLNVEEDGINKDKFDIKTRALSPLIDGARLLTLSHGIKGINNTYLRFKQLAIVDPRNAEIYTNCAEGFLILSKLKTLEGLKDNNSGQFINLEESSKNDKESLKNALAPMRHLEELIKNRFKLTQFS